MSRNVRVQSYIISMFQSFVFLLLYIIAHVHQQKRAAKGRMSRSSVRGVTSGSGDSTSAPADKKVSSVVGGKCGGVRPSLARWRLKNEEMLAALAASSGPSP